MSYFYDHGMLSQMDTDDYNYFFDGEEEDEPYVTYYQEDVQKSEEAEAYKYFLESWVNTMKSLEARRKRELKNELGNLVDQMVNLKIKPSTNEVAYELSDIFSELNISVPQNVVGQVASKLTK